MTATISRPANHPPIPMPVAPDASNPRSAKVPTTPISAAPGGSTSPAPAPAAMPELLPAQGSKRPRRASRPATPTADPPGEASTTGGRWPIDAQKTYAAGSTVPGPAAVDVAAPAGQTLLDPALRLAADILDDLERVRIANENRLRQLTRDAVDKDGEERGFGLDETHPDVARLAAMVETLKRVEHDAELNLNRKMRAHPLGAWVKAQKGVGEKQGARLLAAVGDPYIRPELLNEDGSVKSKEGPRTVSALWAYCGLHVLPGGHRRFDTHTTHAAGDQHRDTDQCCLDAQTEAVGVAAKRKKGQRANWSTKAKMRAYLIAESCIKQLSPQCRDGHSSTDAQCRSAVPACACSPYRVVYDLRRAHTAATHPDWTDGHSHNDALRVASKEILKHLWRAARDWHLTNGATA